MSSNLQNKGSGSYQKLVPGKEGEIVEKVEKPVIRIPSNQRQQILKEKLKGNLGQPEKPIIQFNEEPLIQRIDQAKKEGVEKPELVFEQGNEIQRLDQVKKNGLEKPVLVFEQGNEPGVERKVQQINPEDKKVLELENENKLKPAKKEINLLNDQPYELDLGKEEGILDLKLGDRKDDKKEREGILDLKLGDRKDDKKEREGILDLKLGDRKDDKKQLEFDILERNGQKKEIDLVGFGKNGNKKEIDLGFGKKIDLGVNGNKKELNGIDLNKFKKIQEDQIKPKIDLNGFKKIDDMKNLNGFKLQDDKLLTNEQDSEKLDIEDRINKIMDKNKILEDLNQEDRELSKDDEEYQDENQMDMEEKLKELIASASKQEQFPSPSGPVPSGPVPSGTAIRSRSGPTSVPSTPVPSTPVVPSASFPTKTFPQVIPPAPTPTTIAPQTTSGSISTSMVKTQIIFVEDVNCPPCGFPVPYHRRTLNQELALLEKFSDQQLNMIGCDRNIPDVFVQPRQRKIQMILADPFRKEMNPRSPLEDMTVGDLIYLAGREGVNVQRIPDRFNTRRILTALIQFQRKRCDLIQNNLLTDDDLRTIVYVLEGCNDIPYAWTLERRDLQNIMDTGKFPMCNDQFLIRWKRYETLNILPQNFLQSLAFQIPCSELSMVPTDQYMIARIIDVPENPFEHIYAKDRMIDIQMLKLHFGILVPPTWDALDYLALNGAHYPLKKQQEPLCLDKLLSIGTRKGRMEYLSLYNDVEILSTVKNYVPYESRREFLENILNLFDENEYTYFVSLIPELDGKIYYGNYMKSEVYNSELLSQSILYFSAQQYPLEDRICVLKKMRQLQNLLLSRQIMNPLLASSLSRLISNYEMTPDAYSLLNAFLSLPCSEICCIRKIFYQKFYYYQTRNILFIPILESDFLKALPKLGNINQPNPNSKSMQRVQESFQNELYQTIAYMRLFFGYVPHSTRNI
jgi:hypothetical protein